MAEEALQQEVEQEELTEVELPESEEETEEEKELSVPTRPENSGTPSKTRALERP